MFAVGAGLGNKVQLVRKQRLLTGDQICRGDRPALAASCWTSPANSPFRPAADLGHRQLSGASTVGYPRLNDAPIDVLRLTGRCRSIDSGRLVLRALDILFG